LIKSVEDDIVKLELTYPQDVDYRKEVYDFIKKQNWTILGMQRYISSLEDIFRNLTGGTTDE
jgi:sRNA-binding carbon storage regulator CsrA